MLEDSEQLECYQVIWEEAEEATKTIVLIKTVIIIALKIIHFKKYYKK